MSKILVVVQVDPSTLVPGEKCVCIAEQGAPGEMVRLRPGYLAFYNTDSKTWQKVQVISDGDEILAMAEPSQALGNGHSPAVDQTL